MMMMVMVTMMMMINNDNNNSNNNNYYYFYGNYTFELRHLYCHYIMLSKYQHADTSKTNVGKNCLVNSYHIQQHLAIGGSFSKLTLSGVLNLFSKFYVGSKSGF